MLRNRMNTPVETDPNRRAFIADEVATGDKTVPTTLYHKSEDGSEFVPFGSMAIPIKLKRAVAFSPFRGEADTTVTLTEPAQCLVISNDSDRDLTYTINGESYPVLGREMMSEEYEDFTSVTITATGPFRAYVRKYV